MKTVFYFLIILVSAMSLALASTLESLQQTQQDPQQTAVGPISGDVYQEGLSPEKFNTSPNPAPATKEEVIENTVLRNGKNIIQAQEAKEIEIEVSPDAERPSYNQPNPNKIGN